MTIVNIVSEAFGSPIKSDLASPSIWQSLLHSALSFPNKLAVASLHQDANLYNIGAQKQGKKYLRWSYAQLLTAVDRLASNLIKVGVRRDHTIASFLYNGVEFIIAFWTAHKLGCTFVPISPRTLLNAVEASHMLRITDTTIVLVQDAEIAKQIDALSNTKIPQKFKIIVSPSGTTSQWRSFASLLEASTNINDHILVSQDDSYATERTVTVLFTSGTTSLPKGCPHSDRTLAAFCLNLSLGGQSERDTFCSVLPNNHAMGYFYCLHFFRRGGAVVYPSASFEPPAMLRALEDESCTHACLVPTALYALLDTIKRSDSRFKSSLVDVCLAGASVTPDNIRKVVNDLGSQGVSTGFGMTEGSPIWTAYKTNPADLIRGDITLVGSASPGTRIRICLPNSRIAVNRGVKGEIHQCGPGVISRYLGNTSPESFYRDEEGQTWFVSGDQGIMYADGLVSITGRYKDMIIRGGENISPAAIEAVLNQVDGVHTQVIGVPDPIAGEVPIAIVLCAGGLDVRLIRLLQNAVLNAMGAAFLPARFVALADLGITDFPKTTSGKVQKTRLAQIYQQVQNQEHEPMESKVQAKRIRETVTRAWYKSTGISIDDLDIDAPYTAFADSISVMRVRDYLRKELGLIISAEDVVDNPSIRSQVDFIQKNMVQEVANVVAQTQTSGPPSDDDMLVMFETRGEAIRVQQLISTMLEEKGFSWSDDVTAVIPATDYMSVLVECELINAWNFAIAIVADGSSTIEMRTALEKTLTNNMILTSFYVLDRDKNAHYVTLKPTAKLWNMCIIDHGSVKTPEDVQLLAMEYPYREHSTAPGPLFRCLVVHVEQTNSAAMVMYVHHIVQDASYTRLVYEDLEQALAKPTIALRPHSDFKAWADSYKALRDSPAATQSVNYHVNRLRELHLHKQAIYPAARVPRQAIQENPDGLDFGFDAPGLADLKRRHPDIIAAVVLKAAMALVNVNRTGHTHAVFNNFEAGRGPFPFQPATVRSLTPSAFEAADVGGPTMQCVCNIVPVPHSDSAISLLKRMQQDQSELTKYCHAPFRRIISALDAQGHGAGAMMLDVHKAQFLTWIPGFLGNYEHIRVAQIAIRCTVGLAVVAGLGGPLATTYMFSMRWEVANYSRELTMQYVEDLKSAVLWLTDSRNWGVDVGVFLDRLKEEQAQAQVQTRAQRQAPLGNGKSAIVTEVMSIPRVDVHPH